MTYANSYLYQSDAPWLAKPVARLMFSVPDRVEYSDADTTQSLLEEWARLDPHGLWEDNSAPVVQHYEGPGDSGVDVWSIQGFSDPDETPSFLENIAVPISNDHGVELYLLDPLLL